MTRKNNIPTTAGALLRLDGELGQSLAASILFSCLLVLARMAHTGRLTFVFLLWNLFLAYVPLGITQFLAARPKLRRRKALFVFLVLLWILCIPNSFCLERTDSRYPVG
jgi:steroid 5-alpha reductase family enzyme